MSKKETIGCVNHDCDQCKTKRTWAELTQDEFEQLINDAGFTRIDLLMMGACVEQIVHLMETKLKEKNYD